MSAGGTNSYGITAKVEGVTEIQAGSYVFMDMVHSIEGVDFEHSLTVLATVTSRPAKDRAIADAGVKCFADSKVMPMFTSKGIEVTSLSEEHRQHEAREAPTRR